MVSKARSVAFQEFESRHNQELDKYWRLVASTQFAESWWNGRDRGTWPETIAKEAKDANDIAAHIELTPTAFLTNQSHVVAWARSFTLVAIVTSFETYLRRALERGLVVQPTLLSKFQMQLQASDLASSVDDGSIKHWIARKVADNFLRKEKHRDVYKRLSDIFRCGAAERMTAKLNEWDRINLLRNAIVHEGSVTSELSAAWPIKFPDVGGVVTFDDRDVVQAHALSIELATAIDHRYTSETIKDADACDLACQLYWKNVRDPVTVIGAVQKLLNHELAEAKVLEMHKHCERLGSRSFP